MQLAGYDIRTVAVSDAPVLQALFESDPHYFEIVQGAPPASDEALLLFEELPPGKDKDDKLVYGVFDPTQKLVAVLDFVRGYPEPQIWYLGLIFVAPSLRSKGFGSGLLEALCDHLRAHGASTLRLAVVRTNNRARELYDRHGFHFVAERERAIPPDFHVMVDVMDRAL